MRHERITLVTGASGVIGSAIAEMLSNEGHRVIGLSLESTSSPFIDQHFEADLTDSEQTRDALGEIVSRYPVNGLVNNAGFTYIAPLQDLAFDRMRAMMEIHLRAALQTVQSVVPIMTEQRFGRIVSIGSRMMLGRPGRAVYGMMKAGLLGMTRSIALELAPAGITVNMVSPGPIDTPLFRQNHPSGAPQTERVLAALPVGRIGQADDVANAVRFFLDERSAFVTGQNLFVCGGGSVGSSAT